MSDWSRGEERTWERTTKNLEFHFLGKFSKDLLRAPPQWLVGGIEEVFAFESALESLEASRNERKKDLISGSRLSNKRQRKRQEHVSQKEFVNVKE